MIILDLDSNWDIKYPPQKKSMYAMFIWEFEDLHWERFPSGCCDLNLGLFCHWRWTVIPNKSGNCLKRYHLICHDVCESDHKVAWMLCWASTSRTTVLNEDIQRSVTIWCPVGSVMSDLWMLSRKLIWKDTHHPVLFWFPPSFFNVLPPNRPKKKNNNNNIYGWSWRLVGAPR